ncbi:phage tail protein, partial [Escherichia coli]|nr:phage tail protein [Escherichia coli]EJT2241736.1 C40 family peptidase [Escherichia coli]
MGNKAIPELGSDVMQQIYLCAINRYPNEACGFLVRTNGDKYRFMEARNVSENPQNTFVMHVDDIMAAEDAGDVIAIWHSHTDESAEASDADRAGCEATEVPWMILAIRKNVEGDAPFHFSEMNVITPDGFEMPYLGRPYVFGVFDCWMLCRDYLKREFNVELNPNAHLHIPSWYTGDNDILDQNYRNEGLVRLAPGTEPQRGDVFFIQYGKMPDHCAVYIGDGMILHHQIDRLSCRAYYGG